MDTRRRLLVSCLDLTALGPDVVEEAIDRLCERAARPVPTDPSLHVAAVCISAPFVAPARRRLAGTGVRIACATGGFPDAAGSLETRLAEIRDGVAAGADEVDVVVDRRLVHDPGALAVELAATRAAADGVTWKAILETGALDPPAIEVLGRAAIDAGADFLKTSTGMGGVPGATSEAVAALAALVVGTDVGVKASGGVRTATEAASYLAIVERALGPIDPERFRIGASALLDALVA